MKPVELFIVLVKTIGLAAIVIALAMTANYVMYAYVLLQQIGGSHAFLNVLLYLSPLAILMLVGSLLLFRTNWLVERVYPQQSGG